MLSLTEQKKKIRTEWKKRTSSYVSDRAVESTKMVETLKARPEFLKASAIAIFYPRDWEPDLRELITLADKTLLLPRVSPEGTMHFCAWERTNALISGIGGIMEPAPSTKRFDAWQPGDLILVPGLVFDGEGNRLGSGKGFYDRFLSQRPKGTVAWGVAFEEQISPTALPAESHDEKVSGLLFPQRFLAFTAKRHTR